VRETANRVRVGCATLTRTWDGNRTEASMLVLIKRWIYCKRTHPLSLPALPIFSHMGQSAVVVSQYRENGPGQCVAVRTDSRRPICI
jgi:hypothetical protein